VVGGTLDRSLQIGVDRGREILLSAHAWRASLDVLNPILEFITKSTCLEVPTFVLYVHRQFVYDRDQRKEKGRPFVFPRGCGCFASSWLKAFGVW
jgi:hypothetical protein